MSQVLEVSDISVWFGGLAALQGVSFHVEPGECLGMIGSNGAGKSTLVDVICGARYPATGEIALNGTNLRREGPRARSLRGLARTFQGLRLFYDLTARENILVRAEALGVDQPLLKTALVLKELALEDVADVQTSSLPLARQKAIAVGQAIVTTPLITILDEPLAGLDQQGVKMVQDLIRSRISDGRTSIILIDHNVSAVAAVASRIVFMHNGVSMLSGPTSDVLRSSEVSELYFGKTSSARQVISAAVKPDGLSR